MSVGLERVWLGGGRLDAPAVQRNFDALEDDVGDIMQSWIFRGEGTPNGFVKASRGALYLNFSGGAGATLWVKETGTSTDTGWVAK